MADGKNRHGCLTAWLILMIVANAATALIYVGGTGAIKEAYPNAPGWVFPVLIVLAVINLVCAIALWQWKRWGFWGFFIVSAIGVVINAVIGLGIAGILAGLIGVAILYGVLQIGGANKGWTQLE